MKELMVQVERVVRPIRAKAARKFRMREELLAHLTGIFEEERAAGGDESAASGRAITRFGDAAELRRELQESVPKLERAWSALDMWFDYRLGETAVQYALRVARQGLMLWTKLWTIVLLAASLLELARHGWSGMWGFAREVLFVWGVMLPVLFFHLFSWTMLYVHLRGALCGGWGAMPSRTRAACLCLLASVLVAATGFGLPPPLRGALTVADIVTTSMIALGAPLLLALAVWQNRDHERRYEQWKRLVIE